MTQGFKWFHSGLCLGGPRHGQTVTHDAHFLRVPILSPSDRMPSARPALQEVAVKVMTYELHPGLKFGDDVIVDGFWVPEGETLAEALRAVFRGLTA